MTTLLIIAHSPLASALKAVASHAYPDAMGALLAIDVGAEEAAEVVEARLRAALPSEPGAQTLILADAFGATPSNAASRVADGNRVRLVAGVNVPMVWRVMCYRAEPLDSLVTRAVQGAVQGVIQGAVSRPQNQAPTITKDDQDVHHHQQ